MPYCIHKHKLSRYFYVYLYNGYCSSKNFNHYCNQIWSTERDTINLDKRKQTNEAATGIFEKLYVISLFYCLARNVTSEAEATIMNTRVVEIQKGPYKSGCYFTTCLNGGVRVIAEITLALISSS